MAQALAGRTVPDCVVAVEAPAGEHVLDTLRTTSRLGRAELLGSSGH